VIICSPAENNCIENFLQALDFSIQIYSVLLHKFTRSEIPYGVYLERKRKAGITIRATLRY